VWKDRAKPWEERFFWRVGRSFGRMVGHSDIGWKRGSGKRSPTRNDTPSIRYLARLHREKRGTRPQPLT
jgi:hypothetical protein